MPTSIINTKEHNMKKTTTKILGPPKAQADRIGGVMLGMAAGDALGAPYEFGPPRPDLDPAMTGGGGFGWEPGEWTDDSSQALVISLAAMEGNDLRDPEVQDQIVAGWVKWSGECKDIGIQTSQVLGALGANPTATEARRAATALHYKNGRSGGNGSLMRTAPVALRYLNDRERCAEAARAISTLTHYDPEAGDACVLWTEAIRVAVLTAKFDLRGGLDLLPESRQELWETRITEAESHDPAYFHAKNGWTVAALQGAWSAISRTPDTGPDHLRNALVAAVRGGGDTDTVAAIAGGLLGARWGVSAIPLEWRRVLHGWPGLRGEDLLRHALLLASGDDPLEQPWVQHDHLGQLARCPHDSGVWLGGKDALAAPPRAVTAVVSLCRVIPEEAPAGILPENHVRVMLHDLPEPEANPNLDFVLTEAADAVAALRAEGHVVLLHCVAAYSRTPTVASVYLHRHHGVPMLDAIDDVLHALPLSNPNPGFRAALRRLG